MGYVDGEKMLDPTESNCGVNTKAWGDQVACTNRGVFKRMNGSGGGFIESIQQGN